VRVVKRTANVQHAISAIYAKHDQKTANTAATMMDLTKETTKEATIMINLALYLKYTIAIHIKRK